MTAVVDYFKYLFFSISAYQGVDGCAFALCLLAILNMF